MLPQFYKQVAPLRADQHQTLFIELLGDYGFARETNSIVVGVSEFVQALAYYPVVFVGADEAMTPAVVTGLRDQHNLFVDADGQWRHGYLPAYLRRYPFVVAEQGQQLTVCIDTAYPGLNWQERGEALFNGSEHSPYLQRMIRFLEGFELEFVRTRRFCRRLVELDLLEDSHANIELAQADASFSLSGFKVVNRERLAALGAEVLKELQEDGCLELIYQHLASLSRFDDLFQRLARETAN